MCFHIYLSTAALTESNLRGNPQRYTITEGNKKHYIQLIVKKTPNNSCFLLSPDVRKKWLFQKKWCMLQAPSISMTGDQLFQSTV